MFGSILMQGLGIGMDILGAGISSSAQKDAGRYNKKLLYQQAEMQEQAMEAETDIANKQNRATKASQQAAFAKSGAVISSGTPLLVMLEQSGNMQMDILENRRNRLIQAEGLRHQGDVAYAQAKNASKATLINSAIGIAGKVSSMDFKGMTGTKKDKPKTLLTMNTRNKNYNTMGSNYYA